MNQHNDKNVGELTTFINLELKLHSELLSTNCNEILDSDEIIMSYFNTVFPLEAKNYVYLLHNQVVAESEIIPFCEQVMLKATIHKLVNANAVSGYRSNVIKKHHSKVGYHAYGDLLFYGVVCLFLLKNKEYFIGLNRFDLIDEMKRLCLTLMLRSLENLTEQVQLLQAS